MRAAIGVALLIPLTMPSFMTGQSRISRVEASFGYVEVGADEVETALTEGRAAHIAAREVLALPDMRFGIADLQGGNSKWVSVSSDGAPVYGWMFNNKSGDRKPIPPSYALRHEIGHDLFIRYLVPSSRHDQYGGDAPDWLDEMAAVAFEGEELTASRRRDAARFARTGTLIPLNRFFTMTHPEATAESASTTAESASTTAGPASAPSRQTVRIRLAVSEDTPRFYAMGRAFYEFLVDRTKSTAIVAELATAFRKGEPLDRWVLTRTGHEGPPTSLEALDADFRAWIASDRRYRPDPPSETRGGDHSTAAVKLRIGE
ncbi:hypothetical protein [Sphingomonas qomolangmaensis]|uniref:Uncharacterized protein n=1 Tax=Sphingomonas qomolangmaensis TaxID=2918765 RepID=A0ABY5LBR3_9SPHN|nr:hypothetical protein [Sphingomonas qomolangmaensis]UUL83174.1 hypothetical protein NMP03_02760 [Sphingomonas qomolangmaensis]